LQQSCPTHLATRCGRLHPRRDDEVAALDFISAKSDAGPFVVAITLEYAR
jgi:hypothetical protein